MSKIQAITRSSRDVDYQMEMEEDVCVLRWTPIVFNVESQILMTAKGEKFVEVITRQAFESANKSDIRALFNHNPDKVLGRSRANNATSTMTYTVDEIGVHVRCTPPDATWAKDLNESIERGDISGCSFRFWASASDYEWTKDVSRGIMIGKLVRASMIDDFAIVTYPAYLQTENSVMIEEDVLSRSLADFVALETPGIDEKTAEEMRAEVMLQRLRLMSV